MTNITDLRNPVPTRQAVEELQWCDDTDLNLRRSVGESIVVEEYADGSGSYIEITGKQQAEAFIRCLKEAIALGWAGE